MRPVARRIMILVVLLAAAAAALMFFWSPLRAWWTYRPNVVLITIDALRPDHLGCYGYKRKTSPDIDRIAAEGILFTNAIATAPWTSPSVTSLMTSTYPMVHQIDSTGEILASGIPLLAEILSEQGLSTAAFVNQPLLMTPHGHDLDRGFDIYKSNYAIRFDLTNQYIGDYMLTGDAVRWIGANRDKRFFLWVHYMNPHGPYTPPPPYDTAFLKRDRYRTGSHAPLLGKDNMFGFISLGHARFVNSSTDIDTYVARYDGEIRLVNDQVRRLYAALKSIGLLSTTVILITSDHGESLGENDWYFTHGMTFETNIRVPLIVKPTGKPDPRRIDALVSLIDIAPTILEIMSIPSPAAFEGKSLLPLIAGKQDALRSYVHGEGGHLSQEYIRSSRYKLAIKRPPIRSDGTNPYKQYFGGREELVELFDLEADPREEKNIAGEKPDIAASLADRLRRWKEKEKEKGNELNLSPPETALIDKNAGEILKTLGYIQ